MIKASSTHLSCFSGFAIFKREKTRKDLEKNKMGRAPCCTKVGLHRGPWTPREDTLLTKYIQAHGEGNWRSLPKEAGLLRCGKSCRLRWMNYLRPDIKRGNISPDEDDLIIRLHSLLGNRWSLIAGRLPGRTDNEIKNYWNTHLSKKVRIQQGSNSTSHHKKISGKSIKDSNKRKNNKCNNIKQKNNKKTNAVAIEKPKLHQPKPVRVTSFTIPRNESFESSISPNGDHYQDNTETFIPWNHNFNDHGVKFFIGGDDYRDQDHFINESSDIEIESYVPTTSDNTLEKLYEEYLQLLKTEEDQEKLDSFAESLLI